MKYPIEVEEKRTINRITFKQTIADFLNAFNVERGLIYTIKLLFIDPGKLIRHFLTDGRFVVVNSFRMLIITTALSLVVLYLSGIDEMVSVFTSGFNDASENKEFSSEAFYRIFTDYYNLFIWVAIPCYGLFTFLFFIKKGYNFAEHMVAQSFYISGMNIIYIILFSFTFVFDIGDLFLVSFLLTTSFFFYLFSRFLQSVSLGFFMKTLFAFLFGNALYMIAIALLFKIFIDIGIIY